MSENSTNLMLLFCHNFPPISRRKWLEPSPLPKEQIPLTCRILKCSASVTNSTSSFSWTATDEGWLVQMPPVVPQKLWATVWQVNALFCNVLHWKPSLSTARCKNQIKKGLVPSEIPSRERQRDHITWDQHRRFKHQTNYSGWIKMLTPTSTW